MKRISAAAAVVAVLGLATGVSAADTSVVYLGGTGTGYLPSRPGVSMIAPVIDDDYTVDNIVYRGAPWDVPQHSTEQVVAVINSHEAPVVYGLSKGAQVARSAQRYELPEGTRFTLVGDPDRKGGLMDRLGMAPGYELRYDTTIIYGEYDGFADFPDRPNLLAVVNAFAGIVTVHPFYGTGGANDPLTRLDEAIVSEEVNPNGTVTTEKRIPAKELPITTLLKPFIGAKNARDVDRTLRPIVDQGYSRNDDPVEDVSEKLTEKKAPSERLRLRTTDLTKPREAGNPSTRPTTRRADKTADEPSSTESDDKPSESEPSENDS